MLLPYSVRSTLITINSQESVGCILVDLSIEHSQTRKAQLEGPSCYTFFHTCAMCDPFNVYVVRQRKENFTRDLTISSKVTVLVVWFSKYGVSKLLCYEIFDYSGMYS